MYENIPTISQGIYQKTEKNVYMSRMWVIQEFLTCMLLSTTGEQETVQDDVLLGLRSHFAGLSKTLKDAVLVCLGAMSMATCGYSPPSSDQKEVALFSMQVGNVKVSSREAKIIVEELAMLEGILKADAPSSFCDKLPQLLKRVFFDLSDQDARRAAMLAGSLIYSCSLRGAQCRLRAPLQGREWILHDSSAAKEVDINVGADGPNTFAVRFALWVLGIFTCGMYVVAAFFWRRSIKKNESPAQKDGFAF
jgi:hypothetical protein